jgi:pectate lyase
MNNLRLGAAMVLAPMLAVLATSSCLTTEDSVIDLAPTTDAVTVDSGSTTTIVGVGSGKCIGIKGSSTSSGALIQLQGCSGSSLQTWTATKGSDGYYTLKSQGSGLCMDVTGASTAAGTLIQQWTCGTSDNQKWSLTDEGNGQFAIISKSSGLALDVVNGSTANGAQIQQHGFGGSSNQLWTLPGATVSSSSTPNFYATSPNLVEVYVNGTLLGKTTSAGALLSSTATFQAGTENVIAIRATKGSASNPYLHAQLSGSFGKAGTSAAWKAKAASTTDELTGHAWAATSYSDGSWSAAKDVGVSPTVSTMTSGPAKGIWTSTASDATVIFRARIYIPANWSANTAYGFAAGVTGGQGGTTVTVTTPAELTAAVAGNTAKIIQVKGMVDFTGTEGKTTGTCCIWTVCPSGQSEWSIDSAADCTANGKTPFSCTYDQAGRTQLSIGSNKTIIGIGPNATIKGKGLRLNQGVSNVIIRNLTITDINPQMVWGGDAILIDNASNIWIDHNKISLIGRQFLVTGFGNATNVTVSYNELDGRTPYSANCDGTHYWTMLFAGEANTITVLGNWIHHTSGRGPHAGGTYGTGEKVWAHLVNDYYETVTGHAADPAQNANLFYEGTYFQDVKIPFLTTDGGYSYAPVSSNVSSTSSGCSSSIGRHCVANGTNSTTVTTFPLDSSALTSMSSYSSHLVAPFPAAEVPYAVPHFAGPGHI